MKGSQVSKNASDSVSTLLTSSSAESVASEEYPVQLNIYGLTELNEKLRGQKVGIFHVGVQVHEHEFSYGYHR